MTDALMVGGKGRPLPASAMIAYSATGRFIFPLSAKLERRGRSWKDALERVQGERKANAFSLKYPSRGDRNISAGGTGIACCDKFSSLVENA